MLRTLLILTLAFQTSPIASNPEPRWWKGNLHTHTFWSDGDAFPDSVATWYREHGYHFLALSDHNTFQQGERWMLATAINARAGVDAVADYRKRFGSHWVETRGSAANGSLEVKLKTFEEIRALVDEANRFLLLPSNELTGRSADGHELHMNATNLPEAMALETASTLPEAIIRNIAAAETAGRRTGRQVLVNANHPNYQWGLNAESLAAVLPLQFFEVWNGVDNDNDPGDATHPSTDQIWDHANTLRIVQYKAKPLYGMATDDTHDHQPNKTRGVPGRAWVMVLARHLTPESLLRAMRQGDFYASTGVTLESIDFNAQSRQLSLRIAPQANERFTTRFIGTRRGVDLKDTTQMGVVLAESSSLTPSYRMRGDELYVRAIVTSNAAPEVPSNEFPYKRAWTQPVGW